jgi:carbamoyltransferase
MNILGISAFYHDSAASLLIDGSIVAAAQEERFTRKKHDPAFPINSVKFCLETAGIKPKDLDYVSFYEKPILKADRLIETYLSLSPLGFSSFKRAIPTWLQEKLFLKKDMRDQLEGFENNFVFPSHHESHAASAFFPSPFEESAILTVDGVGEWATASIAIGEGNTIKMLKEMRFPHSLGLLYSAFTYYCGFKVNSGEYKLMGLAPYGQPVYADLIREKLIKVFDDGSIWMDQSYFNYCGGLTMTSEKFHKLFGAPPLLREKKPTQREMDLAASVQKVTEEVILKMAMHAHEMTGMEKLCLAGGVALNCVANGKLLRNGPFDDIWVQPASGDAGGSLGSALFTWHNLLEKPRIVDGENDSMQGALLGPRPSGDSIRSFLEGKKATYRHYASEDELMEVVSDLLSSNKVVGWVSGQMEFGPRALGARSILGDPRSEDMQTQMNVKIKFRESFRPFAPSILAQEAPSWFEIDERHKSPYMLMVAPVKEEHRTTAESKLEGVEKVKEKRSSIPAVTHVDYSARMHTVTHSNPRYLKLLEAFNQKTGCPILVNTSFNIRGEPIVCTPEDAYRCFLNTDMDALVVEDYVILKEENLDSSDIARTDYLKSFELD